MKYAKILVELGPGGPSLSYVEKKGAEVKKSIKDNAKSDAPWNLGYMREPTCAIPVEAVPYILQAQKWAEQNGQSPVSGRQATWISRLYAIETIKGAESVWKASYCYSVYERICDAAGTSTPNLDTSEFDRALSEGINQLMLTAFSYIMSNSEGVTNEQRFLSALFINEGTVSISVNKGKLIHLGSEAEVISFFIRRGWLIENHKIKPGLRFEFVHGKTLPEPMPKEEG